MTPEQMKKLKKVDLLRQKCELEESKFREEMDNIEFGFEYDMFMGMYSGENGDLGINFWNAMLEANANDFKEFDRVFSTITELAKDASIAFIHYNLAAHKARVRQNFIA